MKRSENIARSQIRTGIFFLVALLLFAWGVLIMGRSNKMFVPKGKISLIMNNVAGLKVGAPVWLAGVEIGVVTSIRVEHPEKNNEVEIGLDVEKDSLKKIGKDSLITIKTRGLMGEKYVDITPSRYFVKVPETRVYGTSIATMDDVTQKAAEAFDRLNSTMDKMAAGEGSMGRLIANPQLYENLTKLTGELSSFVSTANAGQGTIGKLVRSPELYDELLDTLTRVNTTLVDVRQSEGTVSKLIYDRELYDKLIQLAEKSGQAADDMRELNKRLTSPQGSIGKLLVNPEFYDKASGLLDRADRSVKSFEEMADRVNKGEGTAGKLMTDRALYDKMNKMVDDLDLLLKDMKQNPRRYFKFSVF